MSRQRRSTRKYAEKRNSIEGTSQLEIDREEPQFFIKKEKKHKPSRRGRRGRGLNKNVDSNSPLPKKESSSKKQTESKINRKYNNEDVTPHYADRNEFIIAAEYRDKHFVNQIGRPTTTFRDAVKNCPSGNSIFTSDGIKVYPIPHQRLSVDKYCIRNLDTMETEALKYSELSEAIKHCRIGSGVFDPHDDRVY